MTEENNDRLSILEKIIEQIAVAKEIVTPVQLFALAIIMVAVLYLASSFANIDVTFPSLTIIFILGRPSLVPGMSWIT